MVAPALQADNSNVRLVFALRDPIERAYSEYWFQLVHGTIPSGMSFLEATRKPDHWIFDGSKYLENIKTYIRYFGRDAVCVVTSDDLRHSMSDALAEVCCHIGVDSDHKFPMIPARNVTIYPRWPKGLAAAGRLLPGVSRYASGVSRLKGSRVRILFSPDAPKPPMSSQARERLQDRYHPEVEELERVLEIDLSVWKGDSGASSRRKASVGVSPNDVKNT